MRHRPVLILILLLAAWARFGALGADVRFHGDEAYFARYARNAAVYGDWLLTGALDKPPLSIYAMAVSMHLTGVTALPDGVMTLEPARGEWSARLTGALAGLIGVALVMAAAQRLNGPRAACIAGAVAALSPQMVGFDATAFTDPLMLALLTGALAAALHRRAGWSGLLVAAAFASKQQAFFYLPLILLLAGGRWRAALIGFAGGAALLLLWDMTRPDPSIFAIAADNNNPYRLLVPVSEWLPRLSDWLGFGATAFGAPVWTLALVIAAVGEGVRRGRRALLLFCVLYTAAHIALPFNIYDRYLLLTFPLLIVLAAGQLARITPAALTLPAVMLIMALGLTAPARFPSDVRDRTGELIALARFVNAQPLGTIVYNRWLGWEMGYYLGPWSDKRVVYYPTPADFAADAPRNPERAPRLLIAPAWADIRPWLDASPYPPRPAYRTDRYAAWWLDP